jgi:hypothetical protein
MKLEQPINQNYCATVVKIKNIIPLENCENVVATTIFGFQAIVSKSTQVGDVGIVFTAETQLSDEFCYHNNLYRHGDKNKDQSAKGYVEDNRRIRAIKFRGNTSSCFFVSLESLGWAASAADIEWLRANVGAEFDVLNGNPICAKYVVPRGVQRAQALAAKKNFARVDTKHMPEHIDSDNFHKWGDTVPAEKDIIVTQKLHGTSIRVGHTIAKRKLGIFESLLKKFGVKIQETTHDYIYGSRKVIKDINNPYQNHFYGSDIWTREGERVKGLLPENYIVYGELVGFTGELPIQKNYTYGVESGKAELYVYRIGIINNEGHLTDLSWQQVKEFCNQVGLKHVPELWTGKKGEFDVTAFMDKRYNDDGFHHAVPLSHGETVDEGVCIRVDGMRPRILKAKCAKFFEHETKILDEGVQDLESEQSVTE